MFCMGIIFRLAVAELLRELLTKGVRQDLSGNELEHEKKLCTSVRPILSVSKIAHSFSQIESCAALLRTQKFLHYIVCTYVCFKLFSQVTFL